MQTKLKAVIKGFRELAKLYKKDKRYKRALKECNEPAEIAEHVESGGKTVTFEEGL